VLFDGLVHVGYGSSGSTGCTTTVSSSTTPQPDVRCHSRTASD